MTAEKIEDVLIVGAGPTGLSLAITLRQYGVRVRIIDRATQPSSVSKALALWSASLEAMQSMNVVDDFLRDGARLNALCIGDGGRQLARMEVGEGIDSPFPFPLLLPQSETERLLTMRLSALGVTVERGVELAGLAQDDDGVMATLNHADGRTEMARARYLVGCDGARSEVRRALDIPFEGSTEPQTFLLGDVRIDGGGLDHKNIYLWWRRGGTVALFPFEEDTWRIFAVRENDSAADILPTLDELQSHADRYGPPGMRLRDPSWLSVFKINERVAARYRVGRCFLAGDAAHVHSPAGGQGMNTGIQDAVNLGWKLAYALAGIGDPNLLLDSYEPERRAIAQNVVKAAEQKLHLAFSSGAAMRIVKDIAVSLLGNLSIVQKRLQIELSETEIVYRNGPLVALGAPPRRPGRTDVGARARDAILTVGGKDQPLWPLLSESRHTLLLFEDAASPIHAAEVTDVAGKLLSILRLTPENDPKQQVHARYRQGGAGWVLIRPDQVVAARGDGADLSALNRYLDRVLRPRKSSEIAITLSGEA
ncbi:MAG: FAD-dependent monooxygenase [Methylocystis sp.]|uniref:FAD-dependent monooxygenase n=1 Tax=Methylocystis sp. TaxID=1911079 RepID=UPI003DA4D50A